MKKGLLLTKNMVLKNNLIVVTTFDNCIHSLENAETVFKKWAKGIDKN